MDQGFVGPFFCPLCHGKDCLGGTRHQGCIRREKRPSAVAGILDTWGGLRFVVDAPEGIKTHARHDEVVIVVKNRRVHEPIAFDELPQIEADVIQAVARWMERGMPNDPVQREAAIMYRLRQLENPSWKRTLDINAVIWC